MLDTFELYEELAVAMGPEAAKVLATVMGRLYREIASTVTKEEFAELKAIVARLAEAQERTEARVEELAQSQRELAEAQKRTEEEVRKLAKGLRETRQMVGGLSDTVGYVLEDRAIRSLPEILEERTGLKVDGKLKRTFIEHPNGRATELNIFGAARNAKGEIVPILGEAKARLMKKHVDGLLRTAERLENEGLLAGSPQLILVSYTATPSVERYAESKGILVVHSYELEL